MDASRGSDEQRTKRPAGALSSPGGVIVAQVKLYVTDGVFNQQPARRLLGRS